MGMDCSTGQGWGRGQWPPLILVRPRLPCCPLLSSLSFSEHECVLTLHIPLPYSPSIFPFYLCRYCAMRNLFGRSPLYRLPVCPLSSAHFSSWFLPFLFSTFLTLRSLLHPSLLLCSSLPLFLFSWMFSLLFSFIVFIRKLISSLTIPKVPSSSCCSVLTAIRPPGKEKVGFAAQSFNIPEVAGTMSGWISGENSL